MAESPRSRPVSEVAVLGFALASLCALGALASGLGYRLHWWDLGTGFALLRWAAYGAVPAGLAAILGVFLARPHGGRRGLAWALLGVALALPPVLVPAYWLHTARSVPAIHDITTDLENPPAFEAVVPLRRGAPNPHRYAGLEVARQQRRAYPDIGPALVTATPERAFAQALAAARAMGWTIHAAEPETGRVEATDTTFWFGFRDDIVVRVTPHGNGARLDVRSVSRVGRSDLGTNARRVRAYLSALRERLPGAS
ncbi:MAG: DUF1499 domain-containing protein [Gammaproteobacteria bacterium]|nr:DUF1499 domain-containing protein [Gammaproteobacteria bacterium]NIR83351.1 DUF1499 domain-containing protein [Gammaproteobacteria bacterium]NIR91151.1 DUF1499 domain-containing protein [Gammaproteobacteria bacterium]NIU04518.1 DUF1499 domain-containing protein [Gammaproteobacteria bacterium]NIW87154.1 DUF1499 domain-containing protein [Gammaproteobacteria bacterium]